MIQRDSVTVRVNAQGLPAGIMHMQHLHAMVHGEGPATCPTADLDENNDNIVGHG